MLLRVKSWVLFLSISFFSSLLLYFWKEDSRSLLFMLLRVKSWVLFLSISFFSSLLLYLWKEDGRSLLFLLLGVKSCFIAQFPQQNLYSGETHKTHSKITAFLRRGEGPAYNIVKRLSVAATVGGGQGGAQPPTHLETQLNFIHFQVASLCLSLTLYISLSLSKIAALYSVERGQNIT